MKIAPLIQSRKFNPDFVQVKALRQFQPRRIGRSRKLKNSLVPLCKSVHTSLGWHFKPNFAEIHQPPPLLLQRLLNSNHAALICQKLIGIHIETMTQRGPLSCNIPQVMDEEALRQIGFLTRIIAPLLQMMMGLAGLVGMKNRCDQILHHMGWFLGANRVLPLQG